MLLNMQLHTITSNLVGLLHRGMSNFVAVSDPRFTRGPERQAVYAIFLACRSNPFACFGKAERMPMEFFDR